LLTSLLCIYTSGFFHNKKYVVSYSVGVVMTKYLMLHDPFAPAYARLLDRAESFKEAPEHLQKLLPGIAEAGFFYTGKADATQCFYSAISIID
jgi:hypothetical protein